MLVDDMSHLASTDLAEVKTEMTHLAAKVDLATLQDSPDGGQDSQMGKGR